MRAGFFFGSIMITGITKVTEEYLESSIVTAGDYATEDESRAAFETAAKATESFNVYAEVDCWYFGGNVFGDKPNGRIDFLLTPRPSLIKAGWLNGCVGVEVKKSGHKAGPMICQMIDYSKAIFRLPDTCGRSLVCPTIVVAFPAFNKTSGLVASIMANHRLGVAYTHSGLRMNCGGKAFFGGLHLHTIECGYKNGSR
jgi:hypothetical protein